MAKVFMHEAFKNTQPSGLTFSETSPLTGLDSQLLPQRQSMADEKLVAAHMRFFNYLKEHTQPLKEKATLAFVPIGRGIFELGSKRVIFQIRNGKNGQEAFLPMDKLEMVALSGKVSFGKKTYYEVNSSGAPRFIRDKYCAKVSAKELGPYNVITDFEK